MDQAFLEQDARSHGLGHLGVIASWLACAEFDYGSLDHTWIGEAWSLVGLFTKALLASDSFIPLLLTTIPGDSHYSTKQPEEVQI